jgi:hypothetical protein
MVWLEWQIQNSDVCPANIELSCVLQIEAATFGIQYTYDDPNNLPSGVGYAQSFNHPTINSASATIDGSINHLVTA